MKNILFVKLLIFLFVVDSGAQIIYSNTFDNGLDGMKIVDVDGNTPQRDVTEFNGTWAAIDDQRFDEYPSHAAVSVSFYDPPGESDDWLITPLINIPAGALLTWDALSLDANFRDSYEILVSTTGDDPADFTDLIFKVEREEITLSTKSVVLNDYVGQSIYIAFRNVSNDKFLLIIDNIFVRLPFERDVFVKSMDFELNRVSSDNSFISLAETKTLSANLLNFGSTNINDLEVAYSLNGMPTEEMVSGNYNSGETFVFESRDIDIQIGDGQFIEIDIASVNGQADEAAFNNKLKLDFDALPPTPTFSGQDSEGNNLNTFTDILSDKTILYYFFSSECNECENAISALNEFYNSQNSTNDNLRIVGLSVDPIDDNAILNNLDWGAEFPLVEFGPTNERLYVHYARNLGLGEMGELPLAVQICPNKENPVLSTVINSNEGLIDPSVLNQEFRSDHESCQDMLSSVESIDVINEINLFPNPTNSKETTLSINVDSRSDFTISMLDIMGREVKEIGKVNLNSGKNDLLIDVSDLTLGTYLIKITKEDQVNILKLELIN